MKSLETFSTETLNKELQRRRDQALYKKHLEIAQKEYAEMGERIAVMEKTVARMEQGDIDYDPQGYMYWQIEDTVAALKAKLKQYEKARQYEEKKHNLY